MRRQLSLLLAILLLIMFTIPPVSEAATPSSVTIKSDYVRIRSAATTTSSILATVNKGKTYTYVSTTAKDASGYVWYKINYTSTQAGYVREDLATLVYPPAPAETSLGELTVNAGGRLNVRASASATSTKLGVVEDGTKHAYYAVQAGWYKIKFGSGYGWVSGQYVKLSSPTPPPPTPPAPTPEPVLGQFTVNAGGSALNVRATPSVTGTRLGTIADQSVHSYYATQAGWYKILYNGKTGWVSATYVKLNNTTPPPAEPTAIGNLRVTTSGLNVRSTSSTAGAILGVLRYGMVLPYYSTVNGWHQISYGGQTGWVSGDFVALSALDPSAPSYSTLTKRQEDWLIWATGRFIDTDKDGLSWCTELSREYAYDMFGHDAGLRFGNGNEQLYTANLDYFHRIFWKKDDPTTYPERGDIVSWGGGTGRLGHISIVLEPQPDPNGKLKVLTTNWSGVYSVSQIVYTNYWTSYNGTVLGFLRPKAEKITATHPFGTILQK